MKVIKDSFMEWLNHEIMICDNLPKSPDFTDRQKRREVLVEVRNKMNTVIKEEFEKLKES